MPNVADHPPYPPFTVQRAERLSALPPFLFNQIDDQKRAAIAAGKDVINLGVGDPDQPTPGFIIDELDKAARVPVNHQYPACYGTSAFLQACARFMQRRFGVTADPHRQIVALIGSKDGIAHLPLGLLNPGDTTITFTPAYPVYGSASILAGATVEKFETSEATGWLPDFADPLLARSAASPRCKLMWLNFPCNPTGASATGHTWAEAVAFARRHRLVLASDLAYSEIYFDGPQSVPSLWQTEGADLDRLPAIEFHSLSKTFNMTGWRLGFAVGHPDVIGALKQVKDNVDSGVYNAIQAAGACALDHFDHPAIAGMRDLYHERRDIVVKGLRAIGCQVVEPEAGIFVWARCPIDKTTGKPMDSWAFVSKAIAAAAVVTVPGAGFADSAAGWVRVSLTRETARIAEAMARLARVAW